MWSFALPNPFYFIHFMWFSKKYNNFIKYCIKISYTSYLRLRNHCLTPIPLQKIEIIFLKPPYPLRLLILCEQSLNIKNRSMGILPPLIILDFSIAFIWLWYDLIMSYIRLYFIPTKIGFLVPLWISLNIVKAKHIENNCFF